MGTNQYVVGNMQPTTSNLWCPRRSDVPHDMRVFPTTCWWSTRHATWMCSPRHAVHIMGYMSWVSWLKHVVGNMRHVVGNISANVPHDMLCSPRHAHVIRNILMFPTTCTPRHVFVPHDITCVPHDVIIMFPTTCLCRGEHSFMSWGTHVVGDTHTCRGEHWVFRCSLCGSKRGQ